MPSAKRSIIPRGLSLDLVNAQQARRALDYLVGFNLSPLLWKKVRRGLSAGRVQSPALRMICEREDQIAAFVPQEYWTIDAEGEHSQQTFPLKLVEFAGRKVEQFSFVNESSARATEAALRSACGAAGELKVLTIERKQRRRNPSPPFTTSTLQQEASRKLGFSAQRTMRTAQQLYEGVDIGEGSVGLITYMRTDSVALAAEAVTEMRATIERLYGKEAVAEEVRVYKHQVEERPGSARGGAPDFGGRGARRHRTLPRRRPVQALQPDLEARGRLPDGARRVRYRRGRHAGRARWAGAPCAARQRLHPDQGRLHRRVPGGP